MNSTIVDSTAKPVNLLLDALDESFECDASKKLQGGPRLFFKRVSEPGMSLSRRDRWHQKSKTRASRPQPHELLTT
jgi:hypothetical protein